MINNSVLAYFNSVPGLWTSKLKNNLKGLVSFDLLVLSCLNLCSCLCSDRHHLHLPWKSSVNYVSPSSDADAVKVTQSKESQSVNSVTTHRHQHPNTGAVLHHRFFSGNINSAGEERADAHELSQTPTHQSLITAVINLLHKSVLEIWTFTSTQEGSTCEPLKPYSFRPAIPALLRTTEKKLGPAVLHGTKLLHQGAKKKNDMLLAVLFLLICFPIPLQFWSYLIVVYHISDHHQSPFSAYIDWVLVLTAAVWCFLFLKI